MPFQAERFEAATFERAERAVSVPALAAFFDSEPYEWRLRGLTASELHKAIEAGNRQRDLGKIAEAIAENGAQVDAIREAIGLGKGTPGEIAKRIELVVMGSVDPVVSTPVVVKLAENFPVEFMVLSNTVTELTGEGSSLVKPEAVSPETQT